MVLNVAITKKITDFVRIKPRSMQEISEHIKKNWRTAERYVEKIEKESGHLSTRIFREGTRGALKIVYWNAMEEIHSTTFQEEILEKVMRGQHKDDFSPFDIYQHVEDKNKKVYLQDVSKINPETEITEGEDLIGFLRSASKQVIVFSGNLSWVQAKQGKTKIINIVRELLKRNVSIKVVARVSMVGADNAKTLLALNHEVGKDLIEIKHRRHPLRAMIIDNRIVKLREIKTPEYYEPGELRKKVEIFYEIYDKEWIEWMQKIFWKMFSTGMPAEKRIKEIESVQKKLGE